MRKFFRLAFVFFMLLMAWNTKNLLGQVNGDYRTTTSGVWNNNSPTPAIWQQYNGSMWSSSNSPSYTTTASIYVQSGHTLTSGGNYTAGAAKFIIESGGIYNNNNVGSVASMQVKTGGALNVTKVLTIASGGSFTVQNGATVTLDYNAATTAPSASIWNGTENFGSTSNFIVNSRIGDNAVFFFDGPDITATTTSGTTAYFGNLIFNLSASAPGNWTSVFNTLAADLTYGDLQISGVNVNGDFTLFSGSNAANVVVGGQMIVSNYGTTNSRVIKGNNGSGVVSYTVKGNYSQTASQFILASAAGTTNFTLNGNLSVAGSSGKFILYDNMNNTATTTLNLAGNLTVAAGCSVTSGNITGPGLTNTTLNFTNISTKQIDYGAGVASSGVTYKVKTGSAVQLANNNLILNNSASLTVETGATFDFNWNSSNDPLIVSEGSPVTGTNKFTSNNGSTLIITSPDGLSTIAAKGNVQVGTPTYNQTGIFYFVGKTNQETGNGFTSGSSGKLVFVNLADNTKTLTLTNDIGISGGVTLDPLGGKLEIQKGIVQGATGKDFYGAGRLTMTDGEYRISTITTTPQTDYLPQLSGTYTLPGGIVNLNGINAIQVLDGKGVYYNLTFSGSNQYGIDYKGISSKTDVNNTLTISSSAIVDVKDKAFAGVKLAFNMVGTSRFITSGTGTKPDNFNSYSFLPGSTIEYASLNVTAQDIRLTGITYPNIEVTGSNVQNASLTNSINFQSGSTFTVKTGGTFKLQNQNGFTGLTTTAIRSTNNPTIVLEAGSTVEYNAASSPQTVTGRTDYSNLTLSGVSTKTMAGSPSIAGNFTVSGGAVTVPATIIFNGSAGTQNIAGLAYNNIVFANAGTKQFTSDASVSYNSVLTLSAGTLALNGNKITLKAGAAGNYPSTAIIGSVGTASVTYGAGGQFIIERYIPARRAYRFISPAVTTSTSIRTNWMEGQNNAPNYGTHITGYSGNAGGFDVTQNNNPSLFIFNNGPQTWTDVTSTSGTLTAGFPYRLFVRGDRTVSLVTNTPTPTATILRTAGSITTGTVTYNTTSNPLINSMVNKFSYMGNPYASPVNWNTLPKSDLALTYYTWDPNLNTRGGYVSYNGSNGQTAPGSSAVNQYIQPEQAFFVQATGAAPSLQFRESDKATSFTQVFREASLVPRLSLLLQYQDTSGKAITADGVVALFDTGYSSFIGQEDSYKLNNLDENMAINHSDTSLSIEGSPDLLANDTVHLKVWQYTQKNYSLKLSAANFESGASAVVKDAFLNLETPVNMTDSTIIPFAITDDAASFAPDRFMVIFRPASVLPVTITNIRAYESGKGIQVNWVASEEINIVRYEVEKSADGHEFVQSEVVMAKGNHTTATTYGWFDANPLEGNNFYRLKVTDKSGAVRYTEIVKVNLDRVNTGIAVYPNPVIDNNISLHLTNIPKGRYTIALYNNLGQKLLSQSIRHESRAATYAISTAKVNPQGSYTLKVTNGDTEMTTKVIFDKK